MKKVQVPTEYQTSNMSNDSSKTELSERKMEEGQRITINQKGNHELTEYDTKHKRQVTLEFLGTADSEQISQDIRQTLKNLYLKKFFK